MVFLVRGRGAENIEKRRKGDRRKTLKNEKKEKRRIQGKPNNNDKCFWFYLLYKKIYFARKHSLKKLVYVITFYLHILCVAWYLKPRNDTPKLNMHKYTNYNIIEIYMNRLSNTKQIFMVMDYLILMSEKYLHFIKKTKACGKETFSHPLKVTGSMCVGNILKIICISKICTKPWKKFN